MATKRFFSADHATISPEEAYHAIKVLRCKAGEVVELINGAGQLYNALISYISKDYIQLSEIELIKEQAENPNRLSVAICPTKNPARFEWFLEKATEIGVNQIFPIITDRTEKTSIKLERLSTIILSAVKQSKQLFLPRLHPVQTFSNFQINSFSNPFIAHCENKNEPFLGKAYTKNTDAIIFIGPEGDFTPEEIQASLNNNYQPVSLGNSILRVETAGVAACTIVNGINYEK